MKRLAYALGLLSVTLGGCSGIRGGDSAMFPGPPPNRTGTTSGDMQAAPVIYALTQGGTTVLDSQPMGMGDKRVGCGNGDELRGGYFALRGDFPASFEVTATDALDLAIIEVFVEGGSFADLTDGVRRRTRVRDGRTVEVASLDSAFWPAEAPRRFSFDVLPTSGTAEKGVGTVRLGMHAATADGIPVTSSEVVVGPLRRLCPPV
jgi:hypothetical protein